MTATHSNGNSRVDIDKLERRDMHESPRWSLQTHKWIWFIGLCSNKQQKNSPAGFGSTGWKALKIHRKKCNIEKNKKSTLQGCRKHQSLWWLVGLVTPKTDTGLDNLRAFCPQWGFPLWTQQLSCEFPWSGILASMFYLRKKAELIKMLKMQTQAAYITRHWLKHAKYIWMY